MALLVWAVLSLTLSVCMPSDKKNEIFMKNVHMMMHMQDLFNNCHTLHTGKFRIFSDMVNFIKLFLRDCKAEASAKAVPT